MIDLRPEEHDVLARLRRAGGAGLPLLEVRISIAIRLGLLGLAKISSGGGPQRVTITSKGAAFQRRDAFA